MSERQAKLKRKNEVVNAPEKKKSALDIVSNIIIVVLILAVLGIGGWAVYSKYGQKPSNQVTDPPTITEYAQTEGMSVEDFLAKYGLSEVTEINGDTSIAEAMSYMSLSNYATFVGTDVSVIKESLKLGEEITDETPMAVVFETMTAASQDAEPTDVEEETQVQE